MKSLSITLALAIAVLMAATTTPADAFLCRISNLTATCDGSDVQLDWDSTAMCAGETFDVYRSINGGTEVLIAGGVSDTDYLDDGPSFPGASRSYRIESDCGVGCGDTYSAKTGPITCP